MKLPLLCLTIVILTAQIAVAQHPALCQITAGNSGGTGVLIAQDLEIGAAVVLTAQHVIAGVPRYGRVDCYFHETGRTISGRWITANSRIDIALVIIRADPDLIPSRIAKIPPAVGEEVISEGYPYYTPARRGQFAQVVGAVTGYEASQMRTNIQPISGNSGGPVFNDNYELCALTDGYVGSLYDRRIVKSMGPWLTDTGSPGMQIMIQGYHRFAPNIQGLKKTCLNCTQGFGLFKRGQRPGIPNI